MQEQTIYVSDDGQRFDSAEDCQAWERMAQKKAKITQLGIFGPQDEEDERFPPLAVQEALGLDVRTDLGNELYMRQGVAFVRAARHIKTVSDWIWA